MNLRERLLLMVLIVEILCSAVYLQAAGSPNDADHKIGDKITTIANAKRIFVEISSSQGKFIAQIPIAAMITQNRCSSASGGGRTNVIDGKYCLYPDAPGVMTIIQASHATGLPNARPADRLRVDNSQ